MDKKQIWIDFNKNTDRGCYSLGDEEWTKQSVERVGGVKDGDLVLLTNNVVMCEAKVEVVQGVAYARPVSKQWKVQG